jgi:hypothetical protein
MKTHNVKIAGAALTAATLTASTQAAEADAAGLVKDLKSGDDKVRGAAIEGAAAMGGRAVPALADLLASTEVEYARAARRALYKIVRHAGRPGAETEARAVEAELIKVVNQSRPVQPRRDLLWMVSEIGGDGAVDTVASFLGNTELREDARCVLQRIPGKKSMAVLQAAHASAPDDFKKNLAESLVKRGAVPPGFQSEKLKPVKP